MITSIQILKAKSYGVKSGTPYFPIPNPDFISCAQGLAWFSIVGFFFEVSERKNVVEGFVINAHNIKYSTLHECIIRDGLCFNIELYVELISKVDIKIATGETFFSSEQFELWAKNDAIDTFQPDINLVGFREGIKIISIAEKYNKRIVFHNWANAVSNIANISLALTAPGLCKYVESSIVYNPFREKLIKSPVISSNGAYVLSNNKGLGIELK